MLTHVPSTHVMPIQLHKRTYDTLSTIQRSYFGGENGALREVVRENNTCRCSCKLVIM